MRCCLLCFVTAISLITSCKKNISKTDPLTPNDSSSLVVNGGFENDNAATQTPKGWSITGDITAGYVSADGFVGKYALNEKKNAAYIVTASQDVSGLATGYYSLSAFVENSGGQNACYISVQTSDGIERMTSLPVSTNAWITLMVRGVHITDGKCAIKIYSDANANNWCKVDDVKLIKDDIDYTFLKGGDVSELSYIESKGGKFYENNIETDCFQILQDNGFNIVRLRLYNDPGNASFSPSNLLPAGFQNPTDILNLAKRAKSAGMKIELTFHYSDYWTNGATQNKPHDWDSLNYGDLKNAVHDFTLDFMNQMKAQGTIPEYVSLGNETASGILFPDGDYNHFNQMAELFNEGYDAVKEVAPNAKVLIHLDDAGNSDKYEWFFGALNSSGSKYDLIGASYYPFWTNKTVAQIRDWAGAESQKLNKDILIMETGYNWNTTLPDGTAGQLSNNGPYQNIYPSSADGQKDFLLELFNGIKASANGRLIGDLYWDPVMIAVPGAGWELGAPNVVSNTTLFDFTGNALSSLKAFKYNN